MWTGRILTTFTKNSHPTITKTVQISNYRRLIVNVHNIRTLYSKTTLGLDNFVQQCQNTQNQMESIGDRFKEKMLEFSNEPNSKHMVFTEDLKNMIYLTTNDKDIELVVDMIKKFNKQNKELRFGSFVFGPVVMRMFHHYNKPELALECFISDELVGFFDQIITYQIFLDLLFENKKYQEILNCVNFIQEKQLEGMKYPRNVVVLAMAACYKLNSKESLEYALKLWQVLKDTGHYPMRRATTFCAGLAYNQGNPGVALEILTSAKNQNYTTVRNLKVACLTAVGRVENVIPIIKSIFSEDVPKANRHTFNKDVVENVRQAIIALNNPELEMEFNKVETILQTQGHISDVSMDEQLCQEIQPPSALLDKRQNRFQSRFKHPENTQRTFSKKKYYTFQQRPGLDELV